MYAEAIAYEKIPDTVACHIKAAIDAGAITVDATNGAVYSNRFNQPRLLGCLSVRGYLVATLHLSGTRKQIKLHQAVWIATHGEIPSGFVIDHINGVKTDNRICNLRLACPIQNSNNRRSYSGANNPASKLSDAQVGEIRARDIRGVRPKLASEYGVSLSLITKICQYKLRTNMEA